MTPPNLATRHDWIGSCGLRRRERGPAGQRCHMRGTSMASAVAASTDTGNVTSDQLQLPGAGRPPRRGESPPACGRYFAVRLDRVYGDLQPLWPNDNASGAACPAERGCLPVAVLPCAGPAAFAINLTWRVCC